MSDKNTARRTKVQLYVSGNMKAPDDINKHVQSVTYTDSKEKNSDDLQIVFDDREKKWLGNWIEIYPTVTKKVSTTKTISYKVKKGDTIKSIAKAQLGSESKYTEIAKLNKLKKPTLIRAGQVLKIKKTTTTTKATTGKSTGKKTVKAVIVQENWEDTGKDAVLNCGVFDIDTVTLAGPPAKVTMKAAAISYNNAGSQKKRSRAWRNVRLKDVAAKIAKEEKCRLMYEATVNPFFKRKEQAKKTNIKFLEALCKTQGLSLKMAAKIIVIFDAKEYGKKDAIKTIKPGDQNLLDYNLKSSLKDKVYTKCTVSYKNGKSYKRYTYKLPGTKTDGKTLSVKKKVNTLTEAKALAKASITKANAQQFTGTMTLAGSANLVAGNTIALQGFQTFNGKYMIDKATHKISGGYTTTLELSQA